MFQAVVATLISVAAGAILAVLIMKAGEGDE